MRTATPLLLAAALVAGCGDDNEPESLSTFSAELTGAYAESVSGEARYGIGSTGGQRGFALVLGDGGTARVTLFTDRDARPVAGAYEIVTADDPDVAGKFFGEVGYTTGGALYEFEIRSGTLTVTTSEPGAVAGTVELRAVQTFPCCPEAPVQVFLTGTFDARPY